ncbi:MAG: dnaG [Candidatus Saccharibacteria bacterium]|nr:dnaG [Candidatus Saccharibacteria bacterium]
MDAVTEIKARLNIEDVVGEYVQLKRAGRNFKGMSPWTNEKSASFIVSPEKQIWHDFSSGKGGDMFSFVMEMEGQDFRGTLEMLARKAGVDLEQFKSGMNQTSGRLKNQALEILELATRFYQAQLKANNVALEYLINERGFSKQTLLAWRLGYSPNVGHALTDFLTKKGFTTEEMKRAGLVVQRQRGASDMFRGRIMIPLSDSRGQVIGFTARLLDDQPDAPKYINTPQTITYDKSRNVFGLHLAKEAIRKSGYVVVVEGNLDVIASAQAGVANVVASAGTAMTEQHLKELKRFTGDIRLSFDADRAGITASERAIPLAQKVEVALRIITIPAIHGAKDADELVRKDVKLWQKAIDEAVYATDWLIETYKNQLDLTSAAGKTAFTDALLPTVRRLRDPVEQEHYLKMIAEATQTSFEAVKSKLDTRLPDLPTIRLKKPKLKFGPIDPGAMEYQRLQNHLLAMVLMQPQIREILGRCQDVYFSAGPSRQLYEFLKQNPDFKGDPKTAAPLQEIGDYVKIITLQFEELYQDLPLADLRQQAESLTHRLIDRYVKIQKHALARAMEEAASEAEIKTLVQKADKLNELIK